MENNIKFIKSISLANPLPITAVSTNNEIKLTYSNGKAESLLGYSTEQLFELSKDNFKEIIHADDWPTFKENFQKLLESKDGEIVSFDFRIRTSHGNYLTWIARDIVFERSEEGRPLKYASVIQDITSIVRLEQDFAKLARKLNKISYKNSHELRGPVASVLGLMEVMKMDDFQSKYNHMIFKHLETTVTKLDKVIKEITEISY